VKATGLNERSRRVQRAKKAARAYIQSMVKPSKATRKAAQKRYLASPKGKATQKRYLASLKAKAAMKKKA